MPSLAAILGRIACLASQEARRAMVWREKGRSGEAQECERFAESLAEILADVSEPDGIIVGHELAEHRRGYRASDGTLYLVRCDDGSYFDVVERDIAVRLPAETVI